MSTPKARDMNRDLEAASALQAISNSPIRPVRHNPLVANSPAPQSPFKDLVAPSPFHRRFDNVSLTNTPVQLDVRPGIMRSPMEPLTLSRPTFAPPQYQEAHALLFLGHGRTLTFQERLEAEEEAAATSGNGKAAQSPQRIKSDIVPQELGPPSHANGATSSAALPNASTPIAASRSANRQDMRTPLSQMQSHRARSGLKRSTAEAVQAATDDDTQEASGDDPSSPKPCKCKRSKCLKLYCDCFGANRFCNKSCTCLECRNTGKPEHEEERKEAREATLQRNPHAFTSKIMETPNSAQHAHGCKCKRSGCLKKYCECYANGVHCSAHCKCIGCENRADDTTSTEPKFVPPSGSSVTGTARKRPATSDAAEQSPGRENGVSRMRLDEEDDDKRNGMELRRSSRRSGTVPTTSANENQLGRAISIDSQIRVPSEDSNHVLENGDSQPSIFGMENLELQSVVGETSMDAVALFSTQESKGSLGSILDRRLPTPPPPRTVRLGDYELPTSTMIRSLHFLATDDLFPLAATSRFWRDFVTSDYIWQFGASNAAHPSSQGSSSQ